MQKSAPLLDKATLKVQRGGWLKIGSRGGEASELS